MNAPEDRDRSNELVLVGSRWFGWGHHHTVVAERLNHSVREVRMVRDVKGPKGMIPGPIAKKSLPGEWLPAWRVQKFCDRTVEEVEIPEVLPEPPKKPARKRRPKVKNTPRTRKRSTAKRKTKARKRG